ncbi:alpha/beta fold hydrolase [Haladaptatus sp. DYSN1]|uniref:alpha/beta fold hydrolase n=1 Tax=unclassified Haladaptatus TaxID=2622732 RepID=UPI002407146A|nr:alpha/beta hydrolase [Haladaptatus sp. DYSN1]
MPPEGSTAPKRSHDVETGFVEIEGTSLAYQTAGDGTPLVFVHAGIADSRMWHPQFDAFADQYRVVAYDLRGFGDSKLPPEPYAHYRDLGQLLDALDIESAHLVGASMGGATALDFALEHPTRVEILTLVAPALSGYTFTDDATYDGWQTATAAFENGDAERAALVESELWVAGPTRTLDTIDPDVRALVHAMLLQSYEQDTDDATEEPLSPPAIERLSELQAPVLLVNGALDRPDMNLIADILEADVPAIRAATMADVAHLPSLERPDEFNELLRSFLAQHSV